MSGDRATRLALGTLGIGLLCYGVVRILQDPGSTQPVKLATWLAGALLLHDAIIAPIVIGVGWVLARFVADRVRGYIQGGLIVAGLISIIGVVLIYRQGQTASPALALLTQNYLTNLTILLAAVGLVTAGTYLIAVLGVRRRKSRPPADQ